MTTLADGSDKTRRSFARFFPFQPGPDLGHHLAHRMTVHRGPLREPGHLTVQVMALVMGRHPRVHHHPAGDPSAGTASTQIVPDSRRRAGTGIRSSRNHR